MFQFGPGKVYAISGRLPTTPKTRNGDAIMTEAEARHWSIAQYGSGEWISVRLPFTTAP